MASPAAHHVFFCGTTGMGKTYRANLLAKAALARGRHVLYFDTNGNEFACSFRTNSMARLLDVAKRSWNALIVIDDAQKVLTNQAAAKEWEWFVTESRHRGHQTMILAQRATCIPPLYRENMRYLYLYAVNPDTAEVWAEEFGDPSLVKAAGLSPHDCYYKTRPNNGKILPATFLPKTAP